MLIGLLGELLTPMSMTDPTADGESSSGDPAEPPQPMPASAGDRVAISDRTRRLRPAEHELSTAGLRRLLEALECRCHRYTVEIVDDARMQLLHQRWHGDPSTTDVLTFPMSREGEPIDADVACCLDEAERRAGRLGHDRARELVLYALHGLLHIAGHDDHDEESYARMHAEEDRLLELVGLGAVFAPSLNTHPEDDA